ncbi:group II intron reverse transcriptase/maturase [Undibacterium sp. JH2W]|uniref:group II intron reverse transcriptase/maturase n=1 Tax=Undibacterium sp. JH2W TaxID=3413037 RepID=UPI003BF43159
MPVERRRSPETASGANQLREREELARRAKSFGIDKWEVWEAYQQVKAKKGAAGVDRQSLNEFEQDLKGNLYKIWNRMSSGSYMPSAVRRVEIPKATGGMRSLGIPTVADRVAQMVVKRRLEPHLEPLFHNNSFGYRPGKSAHQAITLARLRCLEQAWVVDVDIKAFFDSIDHDLMMRAVRNHVPDRWLSLYIERWLKAPVQMPDGRLQERAKGTPQGGVISPLLSNLFLHYAFDMWMVRSARNIQFERYADDIVCHCATRAQAERFLQALNRRMQACGLLLHPEKTKLVYGRDTRRQESHEGVAGYFDFLGFRFKPRRVKRADGRIETGFRPAMSPKAAQRIREELRHWGFRQHTNWTVQQIRGYWNLPCGAGSSITEPFGVHVQVAF